MAAPLIPALGTELTRAAVRRHRRHRLRRAVAAVATAGSLAGAAALALDAPAASAGIEISAFGGRVVVELTDIETRPAVVEAALRDAGIDAAVTAVPVGPSNVGRFAGLVGDSLGAVESLDSNGFSAGGFAVPRSYQGHLDVRLGRPARPGERYAVYSDALAPGEPLACRDLVGRAADDLVAVAEATPGLDLRILPLDDVGRAVGPALPAPAVARSDIGGWRIVAVTATAPDTIRATVTVDGRSPYLAPTPPATGC